MIVKFLDKFGKLVKSITSIGYLPVDVEPVKDSKHLLSSGAAANISSSIAPNYTKTTYPANSYVMQGGVLYTNPNAIGTAEDWNPAHWTQTTIPEVIDDKIDEVALDPSAVALGNVHLLDEVTSFAADAKILVDSETNGPGAMPAENLLTKTAQNALSGNVAPAFDPTRTSLNQYTIGQSCSYDGKTYTFINNHYGAWSSSDVVASDETDRLPLSVEKTFNIVGGNLTTKYKVFPCDGVRSIRVTPTPNPWPTDTIGGTNPSILIIYAVKADGSTTTLLDSIAGNVPDEIELTLPSGTMYIKFFIRANSGAVVTFNVENLDYINALSDVSQLSSDVYDLENDLVTHESLSIPLTGANLTAQTYFVGVKGLRYVEITPTPNPWPTDTIGGMNPTILQIYSVKADGTQTSIVKYILGSTIPSKIFINLPDGTEKLEFFFRANLNAVVNFNVVAVASKPIGEVESIGMEFVGNGATSVTRYYPVSKFISEIVIDVTPSNWATYPVGVNPTMFSIYAVDANDNNLLGIYNWQRDSATQKGPFYHGVAVIPKGTSYLKVFFRGGVGEVVDCVIHASSSYLPFSDEDCSRVMQNSWRRNVRIPQCLVIGDPHNLNAAMTAAFKATKIVNAIDFAICVGDICTDHPTETNAYENYPELMKSFIPVLPVVGNHDAGSSYYVGNYLPVEKIVENVMGPAIAKGFIPNNTRGYYYKDFSDRKLRVIVVNQYEVGGDYGTGSKWERVTYDSSKPDIAFSTAYSQDDIVNIPGWTDYSYKATENVTTPDSAPSSWSADIPCWHNRRPDAALFGQTQAQWIADTLLSTPANYGVVIAMHTWFSRNAVADETCKFTTKGASTSGASLYGETDFISDIVDAFKNGSNYSETISYTTLSPYNVSCNFANKNAGVKFLGFVGGHFHSDIVFKHSTRSWQKAIHACASGSNSNGDIRLIDTGRGFWYHNFTLIGFDIANNAMNLIKIGSKLTDDGYIRDCERLKQ